MHDTLPYIFCVYLLGGASAARILGHLVTCKIERRRPHSRALTRAYFLLPPHIPVSLLVLLLMLT